MRLYSHNWKLYKHVCSQYIFFSVPRRRSIYVGRMSGKTYLPTVGGVALAWGL